MNFLNRTFKNQLLFVGAGIAVSCGIVNKILGIGV
jgi:hypothetical protein